ncbi:MAG: hypothetical protein J5966_10320, partial [Lachnospiraceae bacterium]|nr:hypothetical protein [Lachnospiraceae bacterium]
KAYMENTIASGLCKVILPLREDVWRKDGIGHISIKKLFPGYLFIETEEPDRIYERLKSIPHFTRLLSMQEKETEKSFLTVGKEDEEFIKTLTEDGLMHVSYVRRNKSGRIEEIAGPLKRYANKITKLDIPHRRAIVEADIFGKHRRIKYSLWTDKDPHLSRFDGKLTGEDMKLPAKSFDIGIREGDVIADDTGIYTDMEFTVIRVDAVRRLVYAEAEMFGTRVHFELKADDVRKVRQG